MMMTLEAVQKISALVFMGCVLPVLADDATNVNPSPFTYPTDNPLGEELLNACRAGNLNEATVLIDQGAPVDNTDGMGYTPLMAAAEKNVDLVKYLLKKGAKLDAQDNNGCTALLHACWVNKTDCVLALLDAGANPNLGSISDQVPLMYAADHGNDAEVTALLAHHADVNANCKQGTAARWAVGRDHLSTLKILADAGEDFRLLPVTNTDPNQVQYPLLGIAATMGDMALLDFLPAHGVKIDDTSANGTTALMTAATFNKPDALEKLIKAGATLDLQDQKGQTALMQSVIYGAVPTMNLLLAYKAKTDVRDKTGKTALIWACDEDHEAAVRALTDAGADINATDGEGETALTHAGDLAEVNLVDILKKKGATRTDVHVIPKPSPDVPLLPERFWALSVGAMYTQKFGWNPKVLGGNPSSISEEKEMLKTSWNVHDKESLLHELDDLRDHGHHEAYQAEGAKLAALSEEQFSQLLAAHPDKSISIEAMRASYVKWKDRTGLAWDLCRSAMLVNSGYAVHYLNEKEAWDRLMPIAQRTQTSFSSWQEMSDNFLDGREIWANARDARFDACAKLLLNPSDSNSPWNLNPWNTDLPPVEVAK